MAPNGVTVRRTSDHDPIGRRQSDRTRVSEPERRRRFPDGKPAKVYALPPPGHTTCQTRPPATHDPAGQTAANNNRTASDPPSRRHARNETGTTRRRPTATTTDTRRRGDGRVYEGRPRRRTVVPRRFVGACGRRVPWPVPGAPSGTRRCTGRPPHNRHRRAASPGSTVLRGHP